MRRRSHGVESGPGVSLVGCGYWGRNLARNLHQMGCLVSVCDSDPRTLQGIKAAYAGLETLRSFERVLADPRVNAIALAVPAAQHYALAHKALLAGKDVFVEKPLALDISEAETLVALARRERRILMVGHLLEYHPAIRKLKDLVDAGDLGEIHYVYSNRLNLGKIRKEENILWSFAPHDISVILSILGSFPEWVSTTWQSYLQKQVADVTLTCLAFPGKIRAHIFVSWLHPFKEQKLVVVGTRKMAVFDDVAREGKLKIYDKGVEWRDGEPVIRQTAESTLFFSETEPLREELGHFVDCLRTRRQPRTDGENGLRVLRILDACQRSAEANGQAVSLTSRGVRRR